MAERAFLSAVAAYLGSAAGPSPAAARVGPAEPEAADELPALVLSLDAATRGGAGVGERTLPVTGALPWTATIDLANPVLPGDPGLALLDAPRRVLVLPHGGLVRADGREAAGAADIGVTVDGAPRAFELDPARGTLAFDAPLPATGTLVASYCVGQWERRRVRVAGVLCVAACAATAAEAADLSDAALGALLAPRARAEVTGLVALSVTGVSSIGAKEDGTGLRRRVLRFAFVFEHETDHPGSSGGIIRSIPIDTHLSA